MLKLIRRWWMYVTAMMNHGFNQMADPAIQLEQALDEARQQDKRLRAQAVNVIAAHKTASSQLDRKMDELERLNANVRQALIMASDARNAGNGDKAAQYDSAAGTIANQIILVEGDIVGMRAMVLDGATASNQAKVAVQQNSRLMQQKIAEKAKLLSRLEQAKMQEEMNAAMAQLTETVGADVPTFNEIQGKIELRYAKAQAASELQGTTVESRILEIEQASANVEAQERLSELRTELGLNSPADQIELAALPATGGSTV